MIRYAICYDNIYRYKGYYTLLNVFHASMKSSSSFLIIIVIILFIDYSYQVAHILDEWQGCYNSQSFASSVSRAKYNLFGERDSGTNLLDSLIAMNFKAVIVDTFGFKHLYCNETMTMMNLIRTAGQNYTIDNPLLVVLITRSPDQWLMARHENGNDHLHHIKNATFTQFLTASPFLTYDFSESGEKNSPKLVNEDGMYRDDIFALRTMKLRAFQYLIETSRSIPSLRVSLTRFEDLSMAPFDVLCQLWQELHLPIKRDKAVGLTHDARAWAADVQSKSYKFIHKRQYFNTDSSNASEARTIFCNKIDWDLENYFGYQSIRAICPK